jgi:hypothetical protein
MATASASGVGTEHTVQAIARWVLLGSAYGVLRMLLAWPSLFFSPPSLSSHLCREAPTLARSLSDHSRRRYRRTQGAHNIELGFFAVIVSGAAGTRRARKRSTAPQQTVLLREPLNPTPHHAIQSNFFFFSSRPPFPPSFLFTTVLLPVCLSTSSIDQAQKSSLEVTLQRDSFLSIIPQSRQLPIEYRSPPRLVPTPPSNCRLSTIGWFP